MITEELSTKDQLDFATVYGCIFSLSTTIEYLACTQGLMAERGANYARNKAKAAEEACQVVYNTLEREITKRMNDEQKKVALTAIDEHKKMVYDIFLLTPDHQRRIKSLINKLQKE